MNSFNKKSELNPIFNSESTNKERTFKKISSPRKSRGGILFLSLSAFFRRRWISVVDFCDNFALRYYE